MMTNDDDVARTRATLEQLAPGGARLTIRDPLVADERRWFNEALDRRLVEVRECPAQCFRRRKWNASGPDHFDTPAGAPRHLFSRPDLPEASLNREYIPHVAAYARAVFDLGYPNERARFSFYRKYQRDLLIKRAGASYETDVEFFDASGALFLQIEAKKDARQVDRLAAQLDAASSLAALPSGTAKEIEYVLDLRPRYLWVVGPGTVDPAPHIFEVRVEGLDAAFARLSRFPRMP